MKSSTHVQSFVSLSREEKPLATENNSSELYLVVSVQPRITSIQQWASQSWKFMSCQHRSSFVNSSRTFTQWLCEFNQKVDSLKERGSCSTGRIDSKDLHWIGSTESMTKETEDCPWRKKEELFSNEPIVIYSRTQTIDNICDSWEWLLQLKNYSSTSFELTVRKLIKLWVPICDAIILPRYTLLFGEGRKHNSNMEAS